MDIYVNGRFRTQKITGIQRVAYEITRRFPANIRVCQPQGRLAGWRGHLWEQTRLPRQSRGCVLWSPCASGPVAMDGHIVTFHDLFPLDSPQWYQTSFAAWRNFCLHRLALTAAHVIAVSDYTKGRLIHHFGVDPVKITIIHNGVDHQMFSSSLESVAATRSALKLPSATYLLSVGSLEPRKNLKRLLAAWSAVVNQLAGDVWLVISGSGNRTVYKSAGLGEVPPRVFLTGYVPEEYLQGLYAGSLGFVYPSLAEGFGLPALEAMACGAPVITSATTALPEVCGSAALYIDPTDIEALAGAMKLVIEDARLRDKLSRMGLERAAQFTWDRAADKTLSVLRKFAGNGLK